LVKENNWPKRYKKKDDAELTTSINNDSNYTFFDYCFIPISNEFRGITDEYEPRKWYDYNELEEITSLANNDQSSAALDAIEKLEEKYKDFYFIYGWRISLLLEMGKMDEAIESLFEGLRNSKRKSNLCANYATANFNYNGKLKDSIKWWVISILMQLKTTKWTTHDPFLYLSYVAKFFMEGKLSEIFLEISDIIRPGDFLRLSEEAVQKISSGIAKMKNTKDFSDIKTVLNELKSIVLDTTDDSEKKIFEMTQNSQSKPEQIVPWQDELSTIYETLKLSLDAYNLIDLLSLNGFTHLETTVVGDIFKSKHGNIIIYVRPSHSEADIYTLTYSPKEHNGRFTIVNDGALMTEPEFINAIE